MKTGEYKLKPIIHSIFDRVKEHYTCEDIDRVRAYRVDYYHNTFGGNFIEYFDGLKREDRLRNFRMFFCKHLPNFIDLGSVGASALFREPLFLFGVGSGETLRFMSRALVFSDPVLKQYSRKLHIKFDDESWRERSCEGNDGLIDGILRDFDDEIDEF